jgi:hypothetical protein
MIAAISAGGERKAERLAIGFDAAFNVVAIVIEVGAKGEIYFKDVYGT